MRLIIYEPVSTDAKAFIKFWSTRYTGYDDRFYEANIGQELTEARILEWFQWKNGTPLSGQKKNSVLRNFVARRDELADLRTKRQQNCWRTSERVVRSGGFSGFTVGSPSAFRFTTSMSTGRCGSSRVVRGKRFPARTRIRSVPTSSSTCRSTRGSSNCLTVPWIRRCGRSENSLARITFRLSPFDDRAQIEKSNKRLHGRRELRADDFGHRIAVLPVFPGTESVPDTFVSHDTFVSPSSIMHDMMKSRRL